MKIKLPNGQGVDLNESISLNEKIELVKNLTDEWMPTLISGWENNSVIFFLDGLANYLVWHKEAEFKEMQDKDVLSVKKVKQMEGKVKSNSIPFSNLSTLKKEKLGLIDGDLE